MDGKGGWCPQRGPAGLRHTQGVGGPDLSPVRLVGEEGKEAGDVAAGFGGVAELRFRADAVVVTTTVTYPGEVSVLFQVRDDRLDGALREYAGLGDLPETDSGVAGEGEEYAGMAGQERPRTVGDAFVTHASILILFCIYVLFFVYFLT